LLWLTDATTGSVMWTNSEMTVTIICVSIPALRPLYKHLTGQSSGADGGNSGGYHYSYTKRSVKLTGRDGGDEEDPTYNYSMNPMGASKTVIKHTPKNDDHDNDNSSDGRSILRESRANNTTIYQTQEVTVTYDDYNKSTEGMMAMSAKQHV
ncbi:hypothetical protein T310_10149, partial [Rasamsonia emersonii CBS 393.64]